MSDAAPTHRVKFDGTINLGHVLTVVTLLGGGFAVYSSMNAKLENHETRLNSLERLEIQRMETNRRIFDQLQSIAVDVATIKGRLGPDKPGP